jgi:hypothetical protein
MVHNSVADGRMPRVRKYSATVAYPVASIAGATSALRGALSRSMPMGHRPDWATLEVTGPQERVDARGRVWFEYHGTVAGL